MRIDTFKQRRNIDDNFSDEKEFNILKTRINNILLNSNIDESIGIQGVQEFCNELGLAVKRNYYNEWETYYGSNIKDYFKTINDLSGLCMGLELLTTIPKQSSINIIIKNLHSSAILKSKIIAGVLTKENILTTYPAGEKILDEKVINNVLSFLDCIPGKHFTNALKSLGTWQSLEALRKCLEEYLRLILNSTKNYEGNINELGKSLKEKNIEGVLKDMIINQLRSLDGYFNETSKHKTRSISISENEYVLYGVANVLKFINETL